MSSIFDVPTNDLIEAIAEELKTIPELKAPEWAIFVKTGVHKERPPIKKDWWYVRCAAILRKVSLKGPIGTEKLRTQYGGKKNMGHKPEHFFKGSGSIIRKALQSMEKAGLLKQVEKDGHKGRIATPKAHSIMDKAASKVAQNPVSRKPKNIIRDVKEHKEAPAQGKPKQEKKPEQQK
jgi:small subunit ribosomal protein S19e